MKIVFFGTGSYYINNKKRLKAIIGMEIVAFLDNNSSLWGKQLDGVYIYSPTKAKTLDYDYIVVMSKLYFTEIQLQLLKIGVDNSKILNFQNFMIYMSRGNLLTYFPTKHYSQYSKKILFVSTELGYTGAPLALIYAALNSMELGFTPTVLAPSGDEEFILEYRQKGITFWIYNNITVETIEEWNWLENFDYIVVNTLLMGHCANEFGKKYPVIWWIHEVMDFYERDTKILYNFCPEAVQNIFVYSVTSHAKRNFKKYFSTIDSSILSVGIPDTYCVSAKEKIKNGKLIFAVIGPISWRKGQDLFLKAIDNDKLSTYQEVEYWFIGFCDGIFAKEVLVNVEKKNNVKILGQKTRKEMEELFPQIDVVVVCSREETLSMAAVEAMIYKKVCIVSDACGVKEYLTKSGKNLIYQWDSTEELANKISWCIEHKEDLEKIGEENRKCYENNFSMGVFQKKFLSILRDIDSYR